MDDVATDTRATTKDRIVSATIDTIVAEGFAGATARSIARRGGFNQALIFYHFGSLEGLLVAVLDKVSSERTGRYVDLFAAAGPIDEKLRRAAVLYREDRESGAVKVISEIMAAGTTRPTLAEAISAKIEPWLDIIEGAVGSLVDQVGMTGVVSPRDASYAVVAFFLGIDVMASLGYREARPEALMETAATIAPLLEGLAAWGKA